MKTGVFWAILKQTFRTIMENLVHLYPKYMIYQWEQYRRGGTFVLAEVTRLLCPLLDESPLAKRWTLNQ